MKTRLNLSRWDLLIVVICSMNVERYLVLPAAWGAWAWFIVITGVLLVVQRFCQIDKPGAVTR